MSDLGNFGPEKSTLDLRSLLGLAKPLDSENSGHLKDFQMLQSDSSATFHDYFTHPNFLGLV